ncbi:uncharacterized protein [Littorina saxatilis]|uniref:Fucolectin-related molecule n=1 Tax=Littorina saxatilis TaxID=31220 RepID=A0AAN9ANW3_9CAEN
MAFTARLVVALLCSSVTLFLELRPVLGVCNKRMKFGPDCEYDCRCQFWDKCNKENGDCSDATRCLPGFAGTACQYVNLAYDQSIESNFSAEQNKEDMVKAVDGNPATCFTDNSVNNTPLTVHISVRSWADVITLLLNESGSHANMSGIEVTAHTEQGHPEVLRPHLATPRDVFITYHLSAPAKLTRVDIRSVGHLPLALCEISVLAGRNVALRRNATKREVDEEVAAPEVVDGDKSRCSRGGDDTLWRVSLGRNMSIWRVKAFTRPVGSVTAADKVNNTVLPEHMVVSDFIFQRENTEGSSEEVCELEIYGDCQDGFYGWECDKQCQCENRAEICDKIRGFCLISGCKPGYNTGDCTHKCPSGTYGDGCARNCSAACVDGVCDHVTGVCTNGCVSGMAGRPECRKSCDKGLYGEKCDKTCSINCAGGVCDVDSGHCSRGCKEGMSGDVCSIGQSKGGGEGIEGSVLLAIAATVSTLLQYYC